MIDYAKISTKEKLKWSELLISAMLLPGVLGGVLLLKLVFFGG